MRKKSRSKEKTAAPFSTAMAAIIESIVVRLMHQPSGQMQGQAADIAIQAEQIIYLKRMLAERIAFHTGQPVERIEADSDRDRWFTAQEALEYGFIDAVIERSALRQGA